MRIQEMIEVQYGAALTMLREAVEQCPQQAWDDASYLNRFWQVSYHALFYTHLYLQPGLQHFVPWEKNREGYGQMKDAVHPYTKGEILAYLDIVQQQAAEQLSTMDLEAPSGFEWLPMSKLELQFYNLRHLQHHTGELYERLGGQGELRLHWEIRQPLNTARA